MRFTIMGFLRALSGGLGLGLAYVVCKHDLSLFFKTLGAVGATVGFGLVVLLPVFGFLFWNKFPIVRWSGLVLIALTVVYFKTSVFHLHHLHWYTHLWSARGIGAAFVLVFSFGIPAMTTQRLRQAPAQSQVSDQPQIAPLRSA